MVYAFELYIWNVSFIDRREAARRIFISRSFCFSNNLFWVGVGIMEDYSNSHKFLFNGYNFDQQQKWMKRREELRLKLTEEFEEIFDVE